MGGDCLNFGCVPSKALIAAGKQAYALNHGAEFGVANVQPKVDYAKAKDHVHNVIATIEPHDSQERFEGFGINVIREYGSFISPTEVQAGDTVIEARRFVIATGSGPFVPPIPGIENVTHYTNENIFDLRELPDHLLVVGGGPIGMEMAQAHRRLGSDVTVIEGFKALGKDDPELAEVVLKNVRADGVNILENTKVVGVEKKGKTGVNVLVEGEDGPSSVSGSHILVATGRVANVNGLDLEKAGIDYDRRGIKVGRDLRTTNKKVYAIGDVAGGLQFTHVAGYHAGLVVQSILFRVPGKENRDIIPWATYTDPELAHVGWDENTAREKGKDITILRWPYAENDRAQAERKTEGLVKVITDKKGKILGASIAGASAGEMINVFALAVSKKMKVQDLRGFIAPYPTMTEIAKRAATSFSAPLTQKPMVRNIIGFLRRFG